MNDPIRQKKAMEAKLGGISYADIAKQLLYANEQEVKEDIEAYTKFFSEDIRNNKEYHRILEISRLERLRSAIWRDAVQGDLRAISQLLRISEQYCKLVGIDSNVPSVDVAVANTKTVSCTDIDDWLEVHNKEPEQIKLRQLGDNLTIE